MWSAFVETSNPESVEVFNKQRYIRSVSGDAKRIAGYHQDGTPRMPALFAVDSTSAAVS